MTEINNDALLIRENDNNEYYDVTPYMWGYQFMKRLWTTHK